ncbi:MAG TPA: hypothetical protein DCZ03_04870, partial [Gammaproteobacteria bacterium]|nr:hypothetical protein [Gammaproteobacteria bacterium]
YFTADDGVTGYKLWKSDGTSIGTNLVKDILPGSSNADLNNFTVLDDTLFFTANSLYGGNSLWVSDGSNAGTNIVADINDQGDSRPQWLFAANSHLYFSAFDGVHGRELWRTDGTELGTHLWADVGQVGGHSDIKSMVTLKGVRYFLANDGAGGGENIWRTDGTNQGTFVVREDLLNPNELIAANNFIYFTAYDYLYGEELWKTDGTVEGTSMVKDVLTGVESSNPFLFTTKGDSLYFAATDADRGYNLWITDGTAVGTILLQKIWTGENTVLMLDSKSKPFAMLNSELYFSSNGGESGWELWKSDGTPAGTSLVKDINTGSLDSFPYWMTTMGDDLYFTAKESNTGTELWKSDGSTEGTSLVKDIRPGSESSSPSIIGTTGFEIYIDSNIWADDGNIESSLWKSDGTEAGTTYVKSVRAFRGMDPFTSIPTEYEYTVMGNILYFSGNDSIHGVELWRSDGTDEGTFLVKDITPIEPYTIQSVPTQLTTIGHNFYFIVNDGMYGEELWKSDGTESGTQMVTDLNLGSSSGMFSILGQ